MTLFLAFVVPLGLSLVLVPVLSRIAPRLGLMDSPNGRKRHVGDVPLIGGVAIFLAFVSTILMLGALRDLYWGLVSGGLLILLAGIAHDYKPMSAATRISAQLLAVAVATGLGGLVVNDLGRLLSASVFELGMWGIPITLLALVAMANAMNLSDGADGLAGGIALIALSTLVLVCHLVLIRGAWPEGLSDARPILLALMGGSAGFLVYNLRTPWRRSARVFLGDSGSMFLGFACAWLAILACTKLGERSFRPSFALWILAVPLFDTLGCIVRRKVEGRPIIRSDRRHLHHLLQKLGVTHGRTVAILLVANTLAALVGVLSWRYEIPERVLIVAFISLLALYLLVTLWLWRRIDDAAARREVALKQVHLDSSAAVGARLAAVRMASTADIWTSVRGAATSSAGTPTSRSDPSTKDFRRVNRESADFGP